LPVRSAVENLERVDLRLMRCQVVAERLNQSRRLLLRRGVEALRRYLVEGENVDGLLGLAFERFDRLAQRRLVERRARLGGELPLSGVVLFRRDRRRIDL